MIGQSSFKPWVVSAMFAACAGGALAQQTFPSKPVRFILPNAPGGSNSVVARMFSERLSADWGQSIIVDNRPGGNNVIAGEALLRSSPDGHTILLVTAAHAINPLVFANQPYDPIKSFSPVATLVSSQYILAVNAAAVPVSRLSDFITLAKSKPSQLNGAGAGSGGVQHLALEVFNVVAGVKLNYVPYKGGGPGMTDLLGGHVQLTFNNAVNIVPHAKSGKLNALAIGGSGRSPLLPQVPTFAEAGLPGFNVSNWFGVMAPARTPENTVTRIANDIARVQALPEIKERLTVLGIEPFVLGPQQFAAYIQEEMAKYRKVIQAAGIKMER